MNDQTSEKGLAGERQALAYLRQHGMRPVCQRYRCPYGEIDLVMLDGECLVFVEVKLRSRGKKNIRRKCRSGSILSKLPARVFFIFPMLLKAASGKRHSLFVFAFSGKYVMMLSNSFHQSEGEFTQ